ncbi:S8 family peptidase [Geminocystis sp. NIES-3709]|uniref:S8 family peptidase n=1 Tax=Geminocystis sp. NIES-3709 TaxID=1617448 RepID=UPI0005FCB6FE|nr:S8 family peptidase [Geminocystis sp. NIES-3709]BAQ67122.1 putative subtilisin proteinase-like protein [Geminocystis sp. NIES-3709]
MSQTPRNRPHLYLRNNDQFRQSIDYTSPRSGNTPPPPDRNRIKHATKLEGAIGKAIAKARQQLESRTSEIAVGQPGFYLEFEVTKDQANEFEKLENKTKQIELVAVKQLLQQEDTVKATVFVPESSTEFFEKKVQQYRDEETQKGNPKNAELITRLENVEIGTVQSLFTDDPALFPENRQSIWWEVWLRHGQLEDFQTIAQRLDIPTKSYIHFPERTVILAMANVEKIEQVLQNSDTIAELRIAQDTPSFFLNLKVTEKEKWAEDLCNRTLPPQDDAVAVCLLDHGVNWRHKLIEKGLDISDLYTCDPNWGIFDSHNHGTEMAGLILYADLFNALQSQEYITLIHRLESVKFLPPVGENEPELYGAITEQATSLPEIQNPKRKRIFCMAVTSEKASKKDGTPSSWSAAIDQLSFGEDNYKRLIIISAGNIGEDIFPSDYLDRNDIETIENPAQAWNALVVGAYTEKVNIIHSDYQGWQPIAPCGDLSPRSRTSVSWENQWPIRPDVVFEGGNYASDGKNPAESIDDLCLLTTAHSHNYKLFTFMCDTSCATALASYMAARILSAHPQYWPETIRALMIHSAEWTSAMKQRFNKAPKQKDKKNLIRRYGYGVPNLDRALNSSKSDLTLIIEDRLLPFKQGNNGIKTNKMNVYDLPWPKEKLEELGETNVELKVTLSYFIEPNPGARGYKRKHRYGSYGLRFEVKRPLETDKEFQCRINQVIRNEEKIISNNTEDNNWFLGSNLRNQGSLHCDIWTGTAVDLANRGMVGVYPVSGWWKEQTQLERYNESVRYTLIVTIRVPEVECDIYTPVSNLISQSMPAKIGSIPFLH